MKRNKKVSWDNIAGPSWCLHFPSPGGNFHYITVCNVLFFCIFFRNFHKYIWGSLIQGDNATCLCAGMPVIHNSACGEEERVCLIWFFCGGNIIGSFNPSFPKWILCSIFHWFNDRPGDNIMAINLTIICRGVEDSAFIQTFFSVWKILI